MTNRKIVLKFNIKFFMKEINISIYTIMTNQHGYGYIKFYISYPKFNDPIRLILLIGKNFYVENIAKLGFPICGPLMFYTIISYSIDRSYSY